MLSILYYLQDLKLYVMMMMKPDALCDVVLHVYCIVVILMRYRVFSQLSMWWHRSTNASTIFAATVCAKSDDCML